MPQNFFIKMKSFGRVYNEKNRKYLINRLKNEVARAFATIFGACENSLKTYHMHENRFMVLVFGVVPSLASLAPERQ